MKLTSRELSLIATALALRAEASAENDELNPGLPLSSLTKEWRAVLTKVESEIAQQSKKGGRR